jgi:hypothetical protein
VRLCGEDVSRSWCRTLSRMRDTFASCILWMNGPQYQHRSINMAVEVSIVFISLWTYVLFNLPMNMEATEARESEAKEII